MPILYRRDPHSCLRRAVTSDRFEQLGQHVAAVVEDPLKVAADEEAVGRSPLRHPSGDLGTDSRRCPEAAAEIMRRYSNPKVRERLARLDL